MDQRFRRRDTHPLATTAAVYQVGGLTLETIALLTSLTMILLLATRPDAPAALRVVTYLGVVLMFFVGLHFVLGAGRIESELDEARRTASPTSGPANPRAPLVDNPR